MNLYESLRNTRVVDAIEERDRQLSLLATAADIHTVNSNRLGLGMYKLDLAEVGIAEGITFGELFESNRSICDEIVEAMHGSSMTIKKASRIANLRTCYRVSKNKERDIIGKYLKLAKFI